MKVYLAALGCKLNESELEEWTRQLAEQGNEVVRDAREADLCIVNTCTVTQAAARKLRMLAKKLAHTNANAQIVLTGCYVTMAPEEARALPNVALVVPNSDKDQLAALTAKFRGESGFDMAESGCRMPEAASGELSDNAVHSLSLLQRKDEIPHPRTRAFVKIEDGCNMSCTYCIIPLARGRARSRAQHEIVAEIKELAECGYQEVILTGAQISDYRYEERELGRGRLAALNDLVRAILDETELPRLRLTSIAPWDLEEEFLDLFADSRLCRHLHLSLQSGSTTVLRRMRRPYSAEQFAQSVAMARTSCRALVLRPMLSWGSRENRRSNFDESLAFVEQMEFARVHVFPYSSRDGTLAARLPLHVPDHQKEARARAMEAVANDSIRNFAHKFVGGARPVLFESEASAPGVWSGYTDNYIRVVTQSQENLANRIVPARIVEVVDGGARGEVI